MKLSKSNLYLNIMATLIVVELFILIIRNHTTTPTFLKSEISETVFSKAAYNPPSVMEVKIVDIDYSKVAFPIQLSRSNPSFWNGSSSQYYLPVGVLGQPVTVKLNR